MRLIALLCLPLLLVAPLRGYAGEPLDLISARRILSELRGEKVYSGACAACHGVAGNGEGPAAAPLDPRPRDFTSGIFKFRSTATGEPPTDEDLIRAVSVGVVNTMMPAWEDLLTKRQIGDVVAYLKTFSDVFEDEAPTPIKITSEPDVTSETLLEGKSIYMIMQCGSCHGALGRGDGPSAKALVDDWGFEIQPFDFTRGDYKGGSDSKSVYKTFNTGLNGTPMPSYADVFSFAGENVSDFGAFDAAYPESDVAALRAYLESQPTQVQLDGMDEAELEMLAERRKWALVHFVQSLSRKKGWAYIIFVEDTELTRGQE